MNTPDLDTVLRAVEDVQRVLGEYVEPGDRDAVKTIDRVLRLLDRQDLVYALDRLRRRQVIRPVD